MNAHQQTQDNPYQNMDAPVMVHYQYPYLNQGEEKGNFYYQQSPLQNNLIAQDKQNENIDEEAKYEINPQTQKTNYNQVSKTQMRPPLMMSSEQQQIKEITSNSAVDEQEQQVIEIKEQQGIQECTHKSKKKRVFVVIPQLMMSFLIFICQLIVALFSPLILLLVLAYLILREFCYHQLGTSSYSIHREKMENNNRNNTNDRNNTNNDGECHFCDCCFEACEEAFKCICFLKCEVFSDACLKMCCPCCDTEEIVPKHKSIEYSFYENKSYRRLGYIDYEKIKLKKRSIFTRCFQNIYNCLSCSCYDLISTGKAQNGCIANKVEVYCGQCNSKLLEEKQGGGCCFECHCID